MNQQRHAIKRDVSFCPMIVKADEKGDCDYNKKDKNQPFLSFSMLLLILQYGGVHRLF